MALKGHMMISTLIYIQLVLLFIGIITGTIIIASQGFSYLALLDLGLMIIVIWTIYNKIKELLDNAETRKSRFQVMLNVLAMFLIAVLILATAYTVLYFCLLH